LIVARSAHPPSIVTKAKLYYFCCMSVKAALSKPFAQFVKKRVKRWANAPLEAQNTVFKQLISGGSGTVFGTDHRFSDIRSIRDFQQAVPIRDYEALRPWVDRMTAGEADILWKGKPIYFCKTSGTTSGAKYIPISKESISNHLDAARNALLLYIAETGNTRFVDGKMIFLQGSPTLTEKGGIPLGRLSGIVAHHVPNYLLKNRVPTFETNCIEDWEEKLEAIIDETLPLDMRLISGIPSWVQMYYERLLERTGKATVSDIFPNYSLFVYGGVNYEPYRAKFEQLVGKRIHSIETYPASEGFIAFQDTQEAEGLLLNVDAGIFFEFVPADEFFNDNPTRLSLHEVEVGINYAILLSTNAGLWAYNIGDTVKFVSTNPYRIVVTGRIKHFISAFGEHVIGEEVEFAIRESLKSVGGQITEFHVAPEVNPNSGLPYHEWFVEFEQEPGNLEAFAQRVDALMQEKNIYYRDLLEGNILRPAVITRVQKGGFIEGMRSRGKLGGQNKVPRLANDRKFAETLLPFIKA